MEKTKPNTIFNQIKDFLKSFRDATINTEGIVNEEELSSEDKKLLEEMRRADNVKAIEEKVNIRKKYGATVNNSKAKVAAEAKVSGNKDSKAEKEDSIIKE